MRRIIKRALELGVVRSGLASARRATGVQKAVILAYHNVVPSHDRPMGDSSLHLPIDEFRIQLDLLEGRFALVPVDHLLSGDLDTDEPVVAITFDDAYRGSLELGIAELNSRGHPAMVFVPPGLLGEAGFWWDLLSEEDSGGVRPDVRDFALETLGGKQEAVLQWASSLGRGGRELPDLYRPADEEEVLEVAGQDGISLGSHTWNHVSLTAVSAAEAQVELRKPIDWLAGLPSSRKVKRCLEVISYPYGKWNPSLDSLTREAGYGSGFLVQGGVTNLEAIRSRPFSISRLNIPRGLSPEGFLARVSGVWPR